MPWVDSVAREVTRDPWKSGAGEVDSSDRVGTCVPERGRDLRTTVES